MKTVDGIENTAEIILASSSPRRRDLLQYLGIPFRVHVANVDEEPHPSEEPAALAVRLARSKACAVADSLDATSPLREYSDVSRTGSVADGSDGSPLPTTRAPARHGPIVLAADTVVALDGTVLGKPANDAEATAMLDRLRGRDHRVLTGVALAVAGEIAWSSVVETRVWMRNYGADEVKRYVHSGRPLDKAGAYGIQDTDFRPVERIEGCHTNVVGLPLCEVQRALMSIDPARRWGPGWDRTGQCDRWALGSTSQRPT